jgi:hypothetical protein
VSYGRGDPDSPSYQYKRTAQISGAPVVTSPSRDRVDPWVTVPVPRDIQNDRVSAIRTDSHSRSSRREKPGKELLVSVTGQIINVPPKLKNPTTNIFNLEDSSSEAESIMTDDSNNSPVSFDTVFFLRLLVFW